VENSKIQFVEIAMVTVTVTIVQRSYAAVADLYGRAEPISAASIHNNLNG
jgi:hypothetical protein